MKDVQKLVEESMESITSNDWARCVDHVIGIEKHYKKSMHIMEHIEPVIINLDESDDSEYEAESDCDE